MTAIAILIILGSVLVFLETVLVGGIWAVGGIGLFGWAVWLAYADFGTAAGIGVCALCVFMCAAAFLIWLYVVPKTSFGKKLYLNTSQDGHAPSENLKALVGKNGTALTVLVPSGKVEIDGVPYDAKCESGHAEKGDRITVARADSFELKVRKI